MAKYFRQGDVVLKQINSIPSGLKNKDLTLAYGEITGHQHRLLTGSVVVDTNGTQYVELSVPTQLVHEEHDTLELPKGCFQVLLQREYDVVNGIRSVLD